MKNIPKSCEPRENRRYLLCNPSIKSIFRITNLIYFRCIRNTR